MRMLRQLPSMPRSRGILCFQRSIQTMPRVALKIWKASGCADCGNTGYKGRIGVFEAILMNEEVEMLVKKSSSEREINDAAKKQGILTILQDGILKALRGITSIDELKRVIDMEVL